MLCLLHVQVSCIDMNTHIHFQCVNVLYCALRILKHAGLTGVYSSPLSHNLLAALRRDSQSMKVSSLSAPKYISDSPLQHRQKA